MRMIAQMKIIPIYQIVTLVSLKLVNYVRETVNVAPILAWTIVMDIVPTAGYNVEAFQSSHLATASDSSDGHWLWSRITDQNAE